MRTAQFRAKLFAAMLLGALLFPLCAAAQVEEARVRIDGMVWPLWAYGAEKALRRLDGVGSVKVDLKSAQAVVLPAKGKSFDPTKIPRAVQDAGFTPGEVIVTGAGTLTRADGLLRLNMAGRVPQFVLGGGAKAGELNGRTDLQGKRIRVTGKLHASHGGKPPAITVDAFTVVSD